MNLTSTGLAASLLASLAELEEEGPPWPPAPYLKRILDSHKSPWQMTAKRFLGRTISIWICNEKQPLGLMSREWRHILLAWRGRRVSCRGCYLLSRMSLSVCSFDTKLFNFLYPWTLLFISFPEKLYGHVLSIKHDFCYNFSNFNYLLKFDSYKGKVFFEKTFHRSSWKRLKILCSEWPRVLALTKISCSEGSEYISGHLRWSD